MTEAFCSEIEAVKLGRRGWVAVHAPSNAVLSEQITCCGVAVHMPIIWCEFGALDRWLLDGSDLGLLMGYDNPEFRTALAAAVPMSIPSEVLGECVHG